MGRIGKIQYFTGTSRHGAAVSDVQVNPGGGPNITGEHFSGIGDDSHPLPGDYVALVSCPGTGRELSVGYLDPNCDQKASAGEKRIYARDHAGGSVVEIHLKNTGTARISNDSANIEVKDTGEITAENGACNISMEATGEIKLSNSAGYITILASGTVDINGFIIGLDGNVTTASGIGMNQHVHAQDNDSAGNTEIDTKPPSMP